MRIASCGSSRVGIAAAGQGTLGRVELASVVSPGSLVEPQGRYLADLMGRGVEGTADAVVLPSSAEEVAAVMRWCYDNEVPLTARGGGTGLAGGAIPVRSEEHTSELQSLRQLVC